VNPIDRFIFARLQKEGLSPSAPADRRALIRRITFDLHGLPPSPEEIEAFEQDRRADAWSRLIDRLLASPHYGERWGRHWLDVIRFGESRGFERNEIINSAWPFRDYVIRSFNDDKPFDHFIIEHLAGDVVGKDNPGVEVGTAFLVIGPYDDVGNEDPVQARLIRANTIDDIVMATGTAFLGLTLSCARCHDHKFDPISIEDYYRVAAVFSGVHHAERVLATPAQRLEHRQRLEPLQQRRERAEQALATFEEAVLERDAKQEARPADPRLSPVHPHLTEDHFGPVEARFVRLNITSNNRDPRNGGNVRIDELEVWTADSRPRNVALASLGAEVEAPTRRAEDFAEAYAPSLVNDGVYGARWVSPGSGSLTITLSRVERISRVTFSADRQKALPPDSGEITFVGEYTLEVSVDGERWQQVADSRQRPPLNDAFARERRLAVALTRGEAAERARLRERLSDARAAESRLPRLPHVWAGRFTEAKGPFHVFRGGDPERPGEAVDPGSPSTLAGVTRGFELGADSPESERRLRMARWLVQEDNPLTARVLANRAWQHHFGAGLVNTPSDFGQLGSPPTHPELLDWLARRVRELGWRLKPLHREILLSQSYQQSAAGRQAASDMDAESRLLWRFPPRRLGAEEIRDSMLTAAGLLDTRMGGPGFKLYRYLQDNVATYIPLERHGPDTYRRAVYHHNARASVVDLLTDFDQPDCAFPAPRRASTTSPLQALTLLNHSFTLEMSAAMAQRIVDCAEAADVPQQVQQAFRLAYGRPAHDQELQLSVDWVKRFGLAAFCRVLFNSNEFFYVE
jgi:hypothetical protein